MIADGAGDDVGQPEHGLVARLAESDGQIPGQQPVVAEGADRLLVVAVTFDVPGLQGQPADLALVELPQEPSQQPAPGAFLAAAPDRADDYEQMGGGHQSRGRGQLRAAGARLVAPVQPVLTAKEKTP